jgi:hypothetical protein
MVHVLQDRYRLSRREEADGRAELAATAAPDVTQVGFAW